MAQFSKTWWGKRFILALERFSNPSRLSRGRSYASNGKVISCEVKNNTISAVVRGSINPYFGVYKEPKYKTTIKITPISSANWSKVLSKLSSKASFVSKLLLNEVPDNIENAFSELGLHLLPYSEKDFDNNCSCPDYENPCKHIAGVYYLVASQLDHDPFLLFELRGLSRSELQTELAKTPLGKILSAELGTKEYILNSAESYYSPLEKVTINEPINPREFWLGTKRLPQTIETAQSASLSAIAVKKQGDFPAFWKKDYSFIAVMEEFYERVKTKNKDVL